MTREVASEQHGRDTDPAPASHVARLAGDLPKAALEEMLARIVAVLFYDDDGHVLRAKALGFDEWQAIREAVAPIAPVSVRGS